VLRFSPLPGIAQMAEKRDHVEIGDTVRFRFEANPPIQGELLYKAGAPGDCWIVRQEGGTPVYIQRFDYMHPIWSDDDAKF
jgi:hypothetical protein